MKAVSAPTIFFASVFLTVAASVSLAQNAAPSVIRWSYGAPNTVTDTTHAAKVEGLKTSSLHVYVALYDVSDTEFNRAWVQVINRGNTAIEFDPQSAILKDGTVIRAEAPEKAANSIRRVGEAKSQELSSAHCNIMATGQNNIGQGATSCQPTEMQMRLSKEVLARSNWRAEWVLDKGLTQKTIAPGEQMVGGIFFKKGKKPAQYVLSVRVGDETFEFPVSAMNKAPSYD